MSGCTDVEGATRTALEALDDVFGFQHAILLLADEGSRALFAVAGHGYEASTAGAEVRFGAGVVGTAAERQRVICPSSVARSRVLRDAVHARGSETSGWGATSGHTIALPALPEAASVAAVPLVVLGPARRCSVPGE